VNHSTSVVVRPRRATPSSARTAAAIVAVAGLVPLAAACGGSPGSHVARLGTTTTQSSSPSGGSSSSASTSEQALAYTSCMRSHGVPAFPEPSSGGEIPKVSLQQLGVSNSQLQAAQPACKSLWPTVSGTQQQQVSAQALRFSRCMRNHGITNFPDPGSNGGLRIPDSVENAPGYAAALNACKPFPPPPNLGPPGGVC